MALFQIDGKDFAVEVTALKRSAAVLDGSNAGRTQDANMHRDIKGTFYNYNVTVDTNALSPTEYDELYELITEPTVSHIVTFPYGQNSLTFQAYIANVDDELLMAADAWKLWGKLSFQITSMSPQRRPG